MRRFCAGRKEKRRGEKDEKEVGCSRADRFLVVPGATETQSLLRSIGDTCGGRYEKELIIEVIKYCTNAYIHSFDITFQAERKEKND
jgi:hypothetical protein